MEGDLQKFKADFFKALAHPLRIRILEVLSEGERNVNELQTALGSEGSAVSQQLAVLRAKNLVNSFKEGTSVVYSLRDPLLTESSRWRGGFLTIIWSKLSRCWKVYVTRSNAITEKKGYRNEVDRKVRRL